MGVAPAQSSSQAAASTAAPEPKAASKAPPKRPSKREAPAVWVVGFWKRLVAGVIDLAIPAPAIV